MHTNEAYKIFYYSRNSPKLADRAQQYIESTEAVASGTSGYIHVHDKIIQNSTNTALAGLVAILSKLDDTSTFTGSLSQSTGRSSDTSKGCAQDSEQAPYSIKCMLAKRHSCFNA